MTEQRMTFNTIAECKQRTGPLIYRWEITSSEGQRLGCYIGKASKGARRPESHYRRNVNRLLRGMHYRKSKTDGYRKVHDALAQAVREGHKITLYLMCNVSENEDINVEEQKYIKQYDCLGDAPWQLNGRRNKQGAGDSSQG